MDTQTLLQIVLGIMTFRHPLMENAGLQISFWSFTWYTKTQIENAQRRHRNAYDPEVAVPDFSAVGGFSNS